MGDADPWSPMATPSISELDNTIPEAATAETRHTPADQVDKHACQPDTLHNSSISTYAHTTSAQQSASMTVMGRADVPQSTLLRMTYHGQKQCTTSHINTAT